MATTTPAPTVTVVCGECDEEFPVDRDLLIAGGDWMSCPRCYPTPPAAPPADEAKAETPECMPDA
jgi:hypothetical protein